MVFVIICRKLEIVQWNGVKTGKKKAEEERISRREFTTQSDFNFHFSFTAIGVFVCLVDKNQTLKDRQNELKAINAISFWHQNFMEVTECQQEITQTHVSFEQVFIHRTKPEKNFNQTVLGIIFELLGEKLPFSIYLR